MQGIVDFLGEYPMKKLYLVSACLLAGLAPTLASADAYGDFVRVECNRSMGFFDIHYNAIMGVKISDFLDNRTPVFFYHNAAPNMDSDIMIINNFSWSKQPFTYKCELSPLLKYDITVSPIDQVMSNVCLYAATNRINITEYRTDPKTDKTTEHQLIKNLAIGCNSHIGRIIGVIHSDEDTKLILNFEEWAPLLQTPDNNLGKPITDEEIKEF